MSSPDNVPHDPYSDLDRVDFNDGGLPNAPPVDPVPDTSQQSTPTNTPVVVKPPGSVLNNPVSPTDTTLPAKPSVVKSNVMTSQNAANIEAMIIAMFPQLPPEQQQIIIAQYIERLTKSNDIKTEKESFQLERDKKVLKIQTWAIIGIVVFLILLIATIVGVFLYLSLKKGVLAESGIISGLATTLKEVMKIIFTMASSG